MSVLSLLSKLDELDIHIELVNDKLDIDAPRGKLTPSLLNQLKEKKEEIIEFFQNKIRTQTRYSSIKISEKKEYYQLSSVQRRLYFLQQVDVKSTAYNLYQIIQLNEKVDLKRLTGIFQKLIKRHESLRTSFEIVEDQPIQRVRNDPPFEIDYCEKASGQVIGNFKKSFVLSRVPLLRVGLIEEEKKKYTLIIGMHHIITDGTSQALLEKDFMWLFDGKELPPLRLQYKDYAEWQNCKEQKKLVQLQENYWLETLSDELPVLNLPTDYPRPTMQSFAGYSVNFIIQENVTKNLDEMLKEEGITLYMLLLAAFNILLSKLSNQEDIIIGTPIVARRYADLEHIVGMFVNTLAMRNFPSGTKTFIQFLREVKEQTIKAYENQDYPFEDLVDKILLRRDTSRNPIFDVLFNLNNFSDPPENIQATDEDTRDKHHKTTSKFDLNLTARQEEKGIFFKLEYCSKLFKADTINRIIEYFKKILRLATENKKYKLADIEIINEKEKVQLLVEFNNTKADFPRDSTVHQLFEKQASLIPGHVAVVGPSLRIYSSDPSDTLQLTYNELNERSNQLAGLFQAKGVDLDSIVGIILAPSIEIFISILAVLKAGGVYLPIAPENPVQRQEYILSDSNATVLATTQEFFAPIHWKGEKIFLDAGDIPRHLFSPDIKSTGCNPGKQTTSNLAYLIYTSGTTGKPKGTLVSHQNLVNYVCWFKQYTMLTEEDNALLTSSFTFDLGYTSIYPSILSGAGLHITAKETYFAAEKLLNYIHCNRITYLKVTPSLFSIIVQSPRFSVDSCRYLRLVVMGGEPINPLDLEKTHKISPHTEIMNHYGPTEATIGCVATYVNFHRFNHFKKQPVIGKPIHNTRIYILGNHLSLLPLGVSGELCISGASIARGYLNRPNLTAEKFISLRFYTHYMSYRRNIIYKTGDLARWLEDKNIEFLGRIDNQVKIRGYRIELKEIENQLLKHKEVKETVVIAGDNGNGNGNHYLCAYIVSNNEIPAVELRNHLSKSLPDYMIPSYLIFLKQIPLIPNGKIDRKALPKPEMGISNETYSTPANETEEILAEMWSELLGIKKDKIGTNHNFFELGGSSLNLIRLVSKMYKEFGTQVSIIQIYNNPTIKSISKLLQLKRFTDSPVAILHRSGGKKIFCFPPQLGYGVLYQNLANRIRDYSWYAFNFIEDMEDEERLNKYANFITNFQPVGPYILLGYSAARRLTIQAAKYLENLNYEVSDIILLDCFFSENENLPTQEQIKKYLKHYYRTLDDFLERSEAMFLKEKVKTKSLKYMKYNLFDKKRLEKVNANIHLILSEDAQNYEQLNKNSWDKLTKKRALIYRGFGTHVAMIDPGTIEKNAEIIKEILQGIVSKHSQNID